MKMNKLLIIFIVMSIYITGCGNQKYNSIKQNVKSANTNEILQEQKVEYKQYTNGRFGFSIEYPSTFVTNVVPDNDDGRIFSARDDSTKLTVSGINNIFSDTAASVYNDLVKVHSNASYKKQEMNWFVVSWAEEDKIVYEKNVVGNGSIDTFIIKYPASQKKYYDSIVDHINSSFKTPFTDVAH